MTNHTEVSAYAWGPPDICPPELILPIFDERTWNVHLRQFLYFVALLYFFLGISVVTDIFMASIEHITSKTKTIYFSKPKKGENGKSETGTKGEAEEEEAEGVEVRVWNDTVANLTLMALGTSAPEILLSLIEIVGHDFQAGELGPGTIVGSAAFNLLFITSICMVALPGTETRRIHRFKVFLVTGVFSLFAYIWLYMMLSVFSPNKVEIWEAGLTFAMFPTLVCFAYATDKGLFGRRTDPKEDTRSQLELGPLKGEGDKVLVQQLHKNGQIDPAQLVNFIRQVKRYPGITDEDAAVLAAAKLIESQKRSALWHRMEAVRSLSSGRHLQPVLNHKLEQVYEAMRLHPEGLPLGDLPKDPPPSVAVVEFHAVTVSVRESIGKFPVTLWRYGNLQPRVRVKVTSMDGSALKGEDYIPVNEVVNFAPLQREAEIMVEIVQDSRWEEDEEFFLNLQLLPNEHDNVQLGRVSIMEVTIMDENKPGTFGFVKRGTVVKEGAGKVELMVHRTAGADGEVTLKWKTKDKTAKAGRDYEGGTGEIVFKHGETKRVIEIPIINDLDPEKDEHFEVELYEVSPGAKIGRNNKISVTIANDDDFYTLMDKIVKLTHTNVDALRIYRKDYIRQIKESMLVRGGDVENARCLDYISHFFAFFWKVLFSLIPPPQILGGWLCFILSLACIGVMTAFVGDIASRFGCLVGLENTMTAITFVALGTSVPDTLASRSILISSPYADDAVGNIYGSNSVNVFLGLGLPWLAATLVHHYKGTVFLVPAGGLGFSVMLYMIAAVLAMALLLLRRNLAFFGNAEIGGSIGGRYISAGILLSLWILYIVFSYLQIQGIISF